jgi:hypothetical protein
MDEAQHRNHTVTGMRSVSKDGPNSYTLAMRVRERNEPLLCHYDEGSRNAQIEWSR